VYRGVEYGDAEADNSNQAVYDTVVASPLACYSTYYSAELPRSLGVVWSGVDRCPYIPKLMKVPGLQLPAGKYFQGNGNELSCGLRLYTDFVPLTPPSQA
jgi:hypothetical protein